MLFIGGPWAGKVYAVEPNMRSFAVYEPDKTETFFTNENAELPPLKVAHYHMYDRVALRGPGGPVEVMVSRETKCVIQELMGEYARNKT